MSIAIMVTPGPDLPGHAYRLADALARFRFKALLYLEPPGPFDSPEPWCQDGTLPEAVAEPLALARQRRADRVAAGPRPFRGPNDECGRRTRAGNCQGVRRYPA